MAEVIKVITGRTVTTKKPGKVIEILSPEFGDCTVCLEPMKMWKNCYTGEEILVCTNDMICDHQVKLKNKIFDY